MLDSLTSANHTDFRQRYENTFGWFIQKDKKVFVHIAAVNGTGVVFNDSSKREFTVFRDSGLNFEFIPVNRGWFNSEKATYYLARHPARQFQRGISGNNTNVYHLSKGKLQKIPCEMKVLSDVFEHSMDDVQAVEAFSQGLRPSLALNTHFCVDSAGSFYFNDRIVGHYSQNTIRLDESSIRQEVSDVIRRKNIQFQLLN